ncbi:16S rRNA methyltransferase [Aerococcus urinaehominis]|uniref:Ribosomal RNA small subunit methyltransferase A n=1 Tax=Aerococcus urinaehominis TaxID=128944 RepID=A0A0X8FLJ1_9LACT|nr:16S rRNA (adenine(1518)-N(6)/adenine(1519)-N(6))-dimethyltransferase RsmA [Aerococcus urinaehominis]AMB99543.1 16S rRNA methyltransferase [Aerococcus urinaehominis]SDM34527.1 16S rRNA (adenine1518-N6/adenine1519-N6)-dimethyltransferase [Aerococcus urinaehominis]
MKKKYIATPTRTGELLAKYGLSAKKSLGQNFLMEPQILDHMVAVADIDKTTNVIEVGPGIGALTEFLALAANQVLAFEIDQRLLPVLAESLADYDNVEVVNADILKVNLLETVTDRFEAQSPLAVVANLPYYITTPIIFHLLDSGVKIDTFALMMQKEVAERLTASPGSKAYGSLSIAIQYYCQAEIAFVVPPTVFKPQPRVDSAVLVLRALDQPRVQVANPDYFFSLVRTTFTQRRKTLYNNLRQAFGKDEDQQNRLKVALDQAGIAASERAENLAIEDFARLAETCLDQGLSFC